MTQAHVNAIAALLNAAGLSVYDTEAVKPNKNPADWTDTEWSSAGWELEFPYVVVIAPSLARVSETWDDVPRDYADYVRITSAGTGPGQARWAAEKAFAAVDRKHPVVAGYSTDIKRTATSPLAVDREVTLNTTGHPVYATDSYLYRATPA